MAKSQGLANISGNYNVKIAAPFDSRDVVDTITDLTNANTFDGFVYAGMTVYVKDQKKHYVLNDIDSTKSKNWSPIAVEQGPMEIVWLGMDGDSPYVDDNYYEPGTGPSQGVDPDQGGLGS